MLRLFMISFLFAFAFCWLGCGGPLFKMRLPAGMENGYRAGYIHHPLFSSAGTNVLGYRVTHDSVIYSMSGDTTVAFGLVFPRTTVTSSKSSIKRVFANDSVGCLLYYDTHDVYASSGHRSVLMDAVLPVDRNAPGYQEASKTITSYYKYFKGYLLEANSNDTCRFIFEQSSGKKATDTAVITGYITCNQDSFVLKPYYYPVPQNKKKGTFIFMLEGFGLYKQNQLYAFLQHAPLIEPGNEKIQLYDDANEKEQLLLLAYLTLLYDRLKYP